MLSVIERVSELAKPVVEELGLILWDVEFTKEHGEQVLRIVIDHPEGVSIGQCEQVSRALDPMIDSLDPVKESYLFQVSSAGLERALKRPSDFERFIGSLVEIKLYEPRQGKKEFTGRLLAHDGDTVTIEGQEPFVLKKVAQARLRYEF